MCGFNDKKFDIKSLKGKPRFYVKELAKPKDTERYREIISKVDYFRKLMLVYRLIHAKDPIKYVHTNIDGRALELTGPQICLFSTDKLSKDKSALKEILLSKTKRRNEQRNTGSVCIENSELCESVRNAAGGENIPGKRAFYLTTSLTR